MSKQPRRGGPIPGGRLSVVGEGPQVSVCVRVATSMREEWKAAAALAGLSMAEFVREACGNAAEIARAAHYH